MAATSGIFDRLKDDHDKHRTLLAKMAANQEASDERASLFEQFTVEVKSHAAAEEQALYSTMMRKPETTDDTRHSVAEHHEIEEMLNDLAATDPFSRAWLEKFKDLRHEYEHHIEEEETDHFPEFEKFLTDADIAHMRSVFERRKNAELDEQEVTPEKMEDAKE